MKTRIWEVPDHPGLPLAAFGCLCAFSLLKGLFIALILQNA